MTRLDYMRTEIWEVLLKQEAVVSLVKGSIRGVKTGDGELK